MDADLRRRLRELARGSGRPPQELIREAVAAYLERPDASRLPAWVGSWTGPSGEPAGPDG